MNRYFRLFATPSFLTGAARLVDLGGVFDKYNQSESEEEADSRALASDWLVVGEDLRKAMNKMDSQTASIR